MTDFKVVLQTTLDTSQIQKQLEQLQKNTSLKVKSDSSTISPYKRVLDDFQKFEILRTNAFKQNEARNAKEQADIQRLGKMQIEALNMEIAAQKRLSAEFDKYQQKVNIFNARNANRDQSIPQVQAATGVANKFQQAIKDGDIEKARQFSKELDVANASMSGLGRSTDGFTKSLQDSIKNIGQFIVSTLLIREAMNGLRDGVQYLIDLNKELTNIRLVTGQTAESANQLGKEYNRTALEMGSTTLAVARTSVEFLRQGRTAQETAELIKQSTMLQKLGNMEATDATEKLTATMNGFQMEVNETGEAVDKLIALDNSFASSTKEIATAMQYSANSAAQAGVDYDHLAAYITVISATSRQSAEMIGTSLRTMFSRLTDISSGKVLDKAGEDISRVENALKRVGIELRDSQHEFRNMQDVIDDVGKTWATLSDTDKAFVAEQIAGKQMMPELIVI